MLKIIKRIHAEYVFGRRINVISSHISKLLPSIVSVLDVGCGDGTISKKVSEKRPNVSYKGIDVMARPTCAIPFELFDGIHIPFGDSSMDAVQYIDVLHHTWQIEPLIRESLRVSSKYIVIKDHVFKSRFDFLVLKFMDWIGNAPHGVELIYNFKTREYWDQLFKDLDLEVVSYSDKLALYPQPFDLIFGRRLHFVALLEKR